MTPQTPQTRPRFDAADLRRAWPEYSVTHNISESELERIGDYSTDVAHAQRVWENDRFWRDDSCNRGLPELRVEQTTALVAENVRDADRAANRAAGSVDSARFLSQITGHDPDVERHVERAAVAARRAAELADGNRELAAVDAAALDNIERHRLIVTTARNVDRADREAEAASNARWAASVAAWRAAG